MDIYARLKAAGATMMTVGPDKRPFSSWNKTKDGSAPFKQPKAYAILLGRPLKDSGRFLLAFDFDDKTGDNLAQWEAFKAGLAKHGPLGYEVVSGSKRGRHMYYYSTGEAWRTINKVTGGDDWHIECRCAGSYIVGPCSRMGSGKSYTPVELDAKVARLPDQIAAKLRERAPAKVELTDIAGGEAREWPAIVADMLKSKPDDRSSQVFKAALRLAMLGWPEADISRRLVDPAIGWLDAYLHEKSTHAVEWVQLTAAKAVRKSQEIEQGQRDFINQLRSKVHAKKPK